jgi:hypothetical protein
VAADHRRRGWERGVRRLRRRYDPDHRGFARSRHRSATAGRPA